MPRKACQRSWRNARQSGPAPEHVIAAEFVFLGAFLSMIGSARYAFLSIQGRTKPNRVTWFLWALAPAIGFVAQVDAGVGLPAVLTLSIGLGPALIFASSFINPSAYWKLSRFDVSCGAVSLAAIIIWQVSGDAALAVLFAVLADLVAAVPTVLKGWKFPETENSSVFVLGGLNGLIALLTIDTWNPETWAFPVYITALGTVMLLVLSRGTTRKTQTQPLSP